MGARAAGLERPGASALLRSAAPSTKRNCHCGGNADVDGECLECSRHHAAEESANRQGNHELNSVLQRRESALAKAQSPDDGGWLPTLPTTTAAAKLSKVDVSVQPVCIANDDGKSPTTVPSLASAQAIWGKCCVNIKVEAAKKVSKTSYKTIDEDPSSSTFSPSTEEADAMKAAGAGGGVISVIVPETFKDGAKVDKNIDGGGVTYMPNKDNASCFLVEGSDPTNVAHELGHAMGYGQHTAGTVMEASGAYDKPNPSKVSAALCTTVRNFAYGTTSATKDCNVTTP
jgi:hypothetical protein